MSNDSKILKKIKEENFKKILNFKNSNGLSINEVVRKLHKNIFFLAGEFQIRFNLPNKFHVKTRYTPILKLIFEFV